MFCRNSAVLSLLHRLAYYKRKRGFSTLKVNYHNNNKYMRQKKNPVLYNWQQRKFIVGFNFPR